MPPGVYHGLLSVDGLKCGRTAARERPPAKPVPDAHVEAPLPHLGPQVAAVVRVQRLTGKCPGDIDRTGQVWVYRPEKHKNKWRGQDRSVPPGPQA